MVGVRVIAPLIVLVAHGLDMLTFLMATQRFGYGGEWGVLATIGLGVGGVLAFKIAMGMTMAWFVTRWRHWLPLMALGGLLPATVNVLSLVLV